MKVTITISDTQGEHGEDNVSASIACDPAFAAEREYEESNAAVLGMELFGRLEARIRELREEARVAG